MVWIRAMNRGGYQKTGECYKNIGILKDARTQTGPGGRCGV